jgi:uncharacterized protein YdiU (UPF0061 family)
MPFRIQHSYAEQFAAAPQQLLASAQPQPASNPQWLAFNQQLAEQLGIPSNWQASDQGLQLYAGNQLPDCLKPIALGYAGHQFGHFVARLGDGRAVLLAELETATDQHVDVQLKGAGTTEFSRSGDGRAPLGPVMREFIVSEAMHALGIPTTRALAAVTTGDWVYREQRLPGAVLTRVASSHLRVGTAQYVASFNDDNLRRQFADYVIARHYPECAHQEQPYQALYSAIIDRQAMLVAQWMSVGFIHGVMNTDNMTLSGETIDYGPCAFMEQYDANTVFSAIDRAGRYAYKNQPAIALWNLARLGEAWLPLMAAEPNQAIDQATGLVNQFPQRYEQHYYRIMANKLGLTECQHDDRALIDALLQILATLQLDYTNSLRWLAEGELAEHQSLRAWQQQWQQRLAQQAQPIAQVYAAMKQQNPAVIPRNHWLEAAITQTQESGELTLFNELMTVLRTPYEFPATLSQYTLPATPEQRVQRTFCGT